MIVVQHTSIVYVWRKEFQNRLSIYRTRYTLWFLNHFSGLPRLFLTSINKWNLISTAFIICTIRHCMGRSKNERGRRHHGHYSWSWYVYTYTHVYYLFTLTSSAHGGTRSPQWRSLNDQIFSNRAKEIKPRVLWSALS